MSHVRCRKCEGRRTLPKHPDAYLRKPPRCRTPGCKSHEYRVDRYRETKEIGSHGRRCNGYHFPHYKGRGACLHNPEAEKYHDHER